MASHGIASHRTAHNTTLLGAARMLLVRWPVQQHTTSTPIRVCGSAGACMLPLRPLRIRVALAAPHKAAPPRRPAAASDWPGLYKHPSPPCPPPLFAPTTRCLSTTPAMADTIDVASHQAHKAFQDQQESYRRGTNRPGLLDGERRRSSVTDAKIKLNSGHYIPVVALGVYKAPNDGTTEDAVKWAFEAGYRHVDSGAFSPAPAPRSCMLTDHVPCLRNRPSAARYANEESVGRAVNDFIKRTGTPREEIFVTSKLWDADHERAEEAIDESLTKLGLDYMDLYLLHSPGADRDTRLKAWKAMEDAVYAGKIKSIGVSNFDVEELDDLLANARIKPAVNQIESHPFFAHEDLRQATIERGIHVQAYSPMAQGAALERPEIVAIAKKHGKSSAQVLLKWGMNIGNIILPKSLTKSRIEANADLFDFELDQDDMDILNNLDEGMKMGKLGPAGTSAPGSRRTSSASGGLSGGKLQMSSK